LDLQLDSLVRQNKRIWDRIICAKLHEAKDVRIFHNNTRFMERMYERYGFERFLFLVESDIIFIICETEIGKIVRTCIDVNWPIYGSYIIADLIKRPKYKKKVC